MTDDPQATAVDGEIHVEADGETLTLSVDDAQVLRKEIDVALGKGPERRMADRLVDVDYLGESAAELLEMKFGDMDSLAEATTREIRETQNIGRQKRMAIEEAVEKYERGEL